MHDTKAQESLQRSNISLWLDTYDDIFSDFDPRPYAQRALSDDFLVEAKKVTRETAAGEIELELMMPKDKRNAQQEAIIKKRFKEHFKKQYDYFKNKQRRILRQGVSFIALGIVAMIISTFILLEQPEANFWLTLLTVVAEPAGWFLFWEGLHLTIFDVKQVASDLKFNKRMHRGRVAFASY